MKSAIGFGRSSNLKPWKFRSACARCSTGWPSRNWRPPSYRRSRRYLCRQAANRSISSSGQAARSCLPPIADQFLPALKLSRQIAERPFLGRDDGLDLADRRRTLARIRLAAEAVHFEAAIVGHHVLKAEMRQPAELQ